MDSDKPGRDRRLGYRQHRGRDHRLHGRDNLLVAADAPTGESHSRDLRGNPSSALALRGEVWGPDSRDLRTALQIRLFVRNHGAVPATVDSWRASVVEGEQRLAEQLEAADNLGLSVFPEREEMSKPLEVRDAVGQQRAMDLSRRDQLPILMVEARVEYHGAFAAHYWTRVRIEVHRQWMVTTRHDTEAGRG